MDAGDLSPVVSPANRKMLAQEMTDADKMYERGALVKVFRALDDDGNGVLTTGEVFKMLSYGAAKIFPLIKPFPVLASLFTTENIASAMKYADLDNNGEVDEREFLGILNSLRKEEEERLALLDVYTALDVDGDSRLTANEIEKAMIYEKKKLRNLLHQFPLLVKICQKPDRFMKAVERADENNDGIVSSREFCELMKQIKRYDEQERKIKVLFGFFDPKNKGMVNHIDILKALVINAKEIVPLLHFFPGLPRCFVPGKLKQNLRRADTNNDMHIGVDELIQFSNAISEEARERSTLIKIFTLLDRNGDKTLDRFEVIRALQGNEDGALREFLCLFPTLSNVLRGKKFESALEKADTDGNGYVDEDEFVQLATDLKLEDEERLALLTIFSILDRNDDKTLSVRELKVELKRNSDTIQPLLLKHPGLHDALEPNRFVAALKRMDTNRDGKVDVKEFVHFAQYLRKQRGGFVENRFHIKVTDPKNIKVSTKWVDDGNDGEDELTLVSEADLIANLKEIGDDLTDEKQIEIGNKEKIAMQNEEKYQRSFGDSFFGIDRHNSGLMALAEEEMLRKTQWKRKAEKERLRNLEMEKYHNWELSDEQNKQRAKEEQEFAMKMRQNLYMSNFYGAENTVKLYSVVKKSYFQLLRPATNDPFSNNDSTPSTKKHHYNPVGTNLLSYIDEENDDIEDNKYQNETNGYVDHSYNINSNVLDHDPLEFEQNNNIPIDFVKQNINLISELEKKNKIKIKREASAVSNISSSEKYLSPSPRQQVSLKKQTKKHSSVAQLPKLHQVSSQGLRFSNPDPQSKMFHAMKQRYSLKGIKKTNSDTLKMIHRRKLYSRVTKLKKIKNIASRRLKKKHLNGRMHRKTNDSKSLGNLEEYIRGRK
eukprot:g8368.t1